MYDMAGSRSRASCSVTSKGRADQVLQPFTAKAPCSLTSATSARITKEPREYLRRQDHVHAEDPSSKAMPSEEGDCPLGFDFTPNSHFGSSSQKESEPIPEGNSDTIASVQGHTHNLYYDCMAYPQQGSYAIRSISRSSTTLRRASSYFSRVNLARSISTTTWAVVPSTDPERKFLP